MNKKSILWKKSYLWLTLAFFLGSMILHWVFGWYAFKNEQMEHHQAAEFNEFLVQALRDTFENWQSEFLQLAWQIAGLAMFLYVGSPSSKEGDDRKEAKLDFIVKKLEPENYERLMKEWEEKFPKK